MLSRTKVIASLAVVGTVGAVLALIGTNVKSGTEFMGKRMLQENAEDTKLFQNFVNKFNRNYLTKEEF